MSTTRNNYITMSVAQQDDGQWDLSVNSSKHHRALTSRPRYSIIMIVMFSSNQGRFSLLSLRGRVSLQGLPQVQAVFLLQVIVGVSDAFNGGAVHAEALARGLMLDGQRRLNGIRQAAPHLTLSLEHLLRLTRADEGDNDDLSTEESATQALLEMCLGLVLQWLSRRNHRCHPSASAPLSTCFSSFDTNFPLAAVPLMLPLRARSCPTLQP